MSSLFIDTLSSPDFICLFDSEKNIIDSISWEGRHAEFDTLTESIDILLDRNALSYSDLANITCIVGPGGFTGIRVTTLVANTIGYSYGMPLYPVTVQQFYYTQESPPPWILPLTKSEVLLWENEKQTSPAIVKISSLDHLPSYTSNQSLPVLGENIPYFQAKNYEKFLKNFSSDTITHLLHPVYARDPNVFIKK